MFQLDEDGMFCRTKESTVIVARSNRHLFVSISHGLQPIDIRNGRVYIFADSSSTLRYASDACTIEPEDMVIR